MLSGTSPIEAFLVFGTSPRLQKCLYGTSPRYQKWLSGTRCILDIPSIHLVPDNQKCLSGTSPRHQKWLSGTKYIFAVYIYILFILDMCCIYLVPETKNVSLGQPMCYTHLSWNGFNQGKMSQPIGNIHHIHHGLRRKTWGFLTFLVAGIVSYRCFSLQKARYN